MKEPKSTYWLVLAMMIMVTILAISKCNAQSYNFNYRQEQKGSYIFEIDGHSLFIHERYVYEQDGIKTLEKEDRDETIESQSYFQDRIEIITESGLWIFFYCEDVKNSQVCELQYHPYMGDMLIYKYNSRLSCPL